MNKTLNEYIQYIKDNYETVNEFNKNENNKMISLSEFNEILNIFLEMDY